MDSLFGGGIAVGTVVLVEDHSMVTLDETEVQIDFSNLFAKYFAAEGVVHNHDIFSASSTDPGEKFFSNLPEITRDEEKPGIHKRLDQNDLEIFRFSWKTLLLFLEKMQAESEMKIAWRYQNQHVVPNSQLKRSYSFNVQKVLPKEQLENLSIHIWNRPRWI